MGRTLYMQCDSGISGDMVVGALLDAGANEQGLREALSGLGVDSYEIRVSRKKVGDLVGCDFDVVVDHEHENHDHDMEWLYGGLEDAPAGAHDHGHEHGHHHGHEHGHHHAHHHGHEHGHHHGHEHGHHHGHEHGHHHAHDHGHEHGHHHAHHHGHEHGHHHGHEHGHHHGHEHRNLADITAIIDASVLPDAVKTTAGRIFRIVAEAEAAAHGMTPETVHFHEVGAIDSIVDVVAAAWCLNDLQIHDVVVSPLAEGQGHIRCAHGVLPIPVPAVAHIAASHGLVLRQAHRNGELVTPTGAAIAAAVRTKDTLPELYRVVATGLGTGKRAYKTPSTVRALVLEDAQDEVHPAAAEPLLWKLETEVDDCTGEALGYTLDLLYEVGAREAHFLPVFMKKGRPGYQIEVLCEDDRISAIEAVLFSNTTTIGIRRMPLERTALVREQAQVSTVFGAVDVKRVQLPDGSWRVYPEHDSAAAVARERDASYEDVRRAVVAASVCER